MESKAWWKTTSGKKPKINEPQVSSPKSYVYYGTDLLLQCFSAGLIAVLIKALTKAAFDPELDS